MSWAWPSAIRLEASSHCQLRCPSCPTTSKDIEPVVGKGFLHPDQFRQLIHANPGLKQIELSNYGEILLNPDLPAIMADAHAAGITLTANNGVNFNHASDAVLESLVKYRFHSLTCSIDGATQENYARYRVRGDLDRVLDNLRRLNAIKARYDSPFPRLIWQFIVFGHNQHELEQARELARSLDMAFHVKLSWDAGFSPLVDETPVRMLLGVASRAEYQEKHGKDYMQGLCHQLWDLPQINWDGKVLGCCRNFWGEFGGNAFRDGLMASVNSEGMRHARDMLQGKREARADIPCTRCAIYLGMKQQGRWLQR